MKNYIRTTYHNALVAQLKGKTNLLQVITGPRQVGKTTLALQVLEQWKGPTLYATADKPDTPTSQWIEQQWQRMRKQGQHGTGGLLVLDEVQKVPQWSTVVKQLFDEDRRRRKPIRVVLLGSSALLMQRGLTESLAGRFELHRHTPWSFRECREYFDASLEEYLFFGGYPVGLELRDNEERWGKYMRDALIETVLSKDLLLMAPVRKPALLRQAFGVAVQHPAEVLSYQKILGTLQDTGNATTIASYIQLLSQAFLLHPLERWSGSKVRRRGSQPKIIIADNGIASAMSGWTFLEWQKQHDVRGRMMENAVGTVLHRLAAASGGELFYWRLRNAEVDFVLKIGKALYAIEVKTVAHEPMPPSLNAFCKEHKNARGMIIAEKSDYPHHLSLSAFFEEPESLLL